MCKESCWLCNENVTKAIHFIGDNSIRLGKDKHNRVALMQKYCYLPSDSFYYPNFCPECGRNLKEDNEMNPKMLTYGICNGIFYAVYKHTNYFSAWFIDVIPTDMTTKGIKEFENDHVNEGDSIAGTYNEVMSRLCDLFVYGNF